MSTAAARLEVPARTRRLSPAAVAGTAVHYLALLAFAALLLAPLYYLVYLAISPQGQEFAFPPHVVPEGAKVSNLWNAWEGNPTLPGTMGHYFRNSLMYAGLGTLGCLVTQSIVGYAFARLRFPGRNVLFALTVGMLMMPFVVTLIPRFILFRHLHLTGTLWPLILPWWFGGSPYGIFLMRQFFMSIPKEIDEAARVDGLGHWRILWTILVPQAVPVLVALGILQFTYFWNDLLGPLIYTDQDSWKPLSLGVFAHARSPFSMNWSLFFSIIVLMVLPLALMFLALQRRFQRGFLFSGLGGR